MKKKSGTSTVREVIWTIKISGEGCEIKDYPFFSVALMPLQPSLRLIRLLKQQSRLTVQMCVCVCVLWSCFKNAYSSTAVSNPHLLKKCSAQVSVSVIIVKCWIYWGSYSSLNMGVLLSDLKSLEKAWDPLSVRRGQAFLSADMAGGLSLKYLAVANLHQIA